MKSLFGVGVVVRVAEASLPNQPPKSETETRFNKYNNS